MTNRYRKIVFFLFYILTMQQRSFGMLTCSDCLHIGWNIGAAGLKSVQPSLSTIRKTIESQRTKKIDAHLNGYYRCLKQMTHRNKTFFKNCFLLTSLYNLIYHHCKIDSTRIQRSFLMSPYFIHTCATSLSNT